MNEKNIIWEHAGKAGLALGGVSIVYMVLTMLTGRLAEDAGSGLTAVLGVVNFLLWGIKFAACIFLMRFFMQRFSNADPSADNARVFRFGTLTALLSALLYSAFYMAYVSFIEPDTFSKTLEMLQENPMLGAAQMDSLEEMIPRMPTISFFVNLVWCWLFGTVLAAIFSRNIPSRNPFVDEQ
jgi:hypothetical protein